jgi:hypothetical protein
MQNTRSSLHLQEQRRLGRQPIRRIWANLSTNQKGHFPHARMKLLASKIYIGLINIDFFHIVMLIFWEISRDTTFRTVNLPIGTVS